MKTEPKLVTISTWESEVRFIAQEAVNWTVETGGDLFGIWNETPTIYLATRAGPSVVRSHAHFKLDVEYLVSVSRVLDDNWGLRYFGDWHSHHRLGLSAPSAGDQRRIHRVAQRNMFSSMAEIIVTFDEGGSSEPIIRMNPWAYTEANSNIAPLVFTLIVRPGISPVRESLLLNSIFPEQKLDLWTEIPRERVRIGASNLPPTFLPSIRAEKEIGDRTMLMARKALEEASGSSVEYHSTAFGSILVVSGNKNYSIAFALDSIWPFSVLEVDMIDHQKRKSEPIPITINATGTNFQSLINAYVEAKSIREAWATDVDGNSAPASSA